MHEISLMQNTIEIALEHAHRQQATKIHRLVLRIGEISGVVPEALEFAFDICTQNTLAEGAKLEIQTVPVLCYCPHCQTTFQPNDIIIYECPKCKKNTNQIKQGKEIELSSLEISQPDP